MSNTYTPNVQLALPAPGDRDWNVAVSGDFAALDALAPVGALVVTTFESPSASLNVRIAPGAYVRQDGTVGLYAGIVPLAVTASAPSYLYLDLTNAGALVASATGFPATAHVRLAVVTAGAAVITSIVDARLAFNVAGAMADGVNLTLGSNVGTQIATAATQKLGFFGKPPITQPVLGAATAGSTYTANEQTMLQTVYNAVRNLGLGS